MAVIRISGDGAFETVQKLFKSKSAKELTDYPPRTAIFGEITDPENGKTIDSGIFTLFMSPHSFTGEDTAEISCHGGICVTGMVLDAALRAGARHAEAGEFTKRAFINGKLTLTGAEGIADLLDAKSETAVLLSGAIARGRLSQKLKAMTDETTELVASLFAYIDYPDEDLEDMPDCELEQKINTLISECDKLIEGYKTGEAVTEGVPAVIVGKPNVGKSSLFNLLLGEDRAIVTDIPGTTRDILEYPVKAGKIILKLCDTAGIRENSSDRVEKIGMERVWRTIEEKSPLVFALFDISQPLDANDRIISDKLISINKPEKIIPVFTKCDLARIADSKSIVDIFGEAEYISEDDDKSVRHLIARAEKKYAEEGFNASDGGVITNIRQKNNISDARALISEALECLQTGKKDICGIMLENALSRLYDIDGIRTAGEIVNRIFSRFCVGK